MDSQGPYPLHPMAVVLPVLSGIAFILDLGPFVWHIRNGNIGAASLIFWLLLVLAMNFINPIIWPRDNTQDWWIGHGLCDIEIRLVLGSFVGCPAAVTCISKRLAEVLDTKKTVVTKGSDEQRRQAITELFICFGVPIAVMIAYYAVHINRYDIFAITGCAWPIDASWVSIVLVLVWPLVFCVFSSYYSGTYGNPHAQNGTDRVYSVLVIIRLYRYRRDFSRLLSNASTTRSRFLRIFMMTLIVLLVLLPADIYGVLFTLRAGLHPYHWSWVHDDWNEVLRFPTQGVIVQWDHITWVIGGYLVFIFFGTSRDAQEMYRGWLLSAGFAKFFPSLEQPRTRSSQQSSMLSSLSNKAKRLLHLVSKDTKASNSL
jgi:pheromone a factor receptor